MSKILIDSDILVYRAGFGVQSEGEPYPPNSHARQALKYMVENIKRNCPGEHVFLLSGAGRDNNFRFEVAKTRPYKGNRTAPKPVYYDYLRSHLMVEYKAIVSEGCEADDLLGIYQTDDSIIVTIDKDLDTVPGKHYNFVKQEHYTVSRTQAYRNFCTQLLTGDSSDNIPGLPGIGPKKAEKILALAKRDKRQMLRQVYKAYCEAGKDLEYFTEQAKLIWIMREEGKQFELTAEEIKDLKEAANDKSKK
jgi:hypothetical protein